MTKETTKRTITQSRLDALKFAIEKYGNNDGRGIADNNYWAEEIIFWSSLIGSE